MKQTEEINSFGHVNIFGIVDKITGKTYYDYSYEVVKNSDNNYDVKEYFKKNPENIKENVSTLPL